jgi:RNA polymerase sigma factor (sigma-70 family)
MMLNHLHTLKIALRLAIMRQIIICIKGFTLSNIYPHQPANSISPVIDNLYREHQGWLLQWLKRRLDCREGAADLTQDVFIKLLLKLEWEPLHEPRAYLRTIAHGLLANSVKRRDLERAYLQALTSLPEAAAPSLEAQAIALETLFEIDALLDGLPINVRRAFLLLQLEGLRHAEIAERLGVSISSVRQYIAKAIQHCVAGL